MKNLIVPKKYDSKDLISFLLHELKKYNINEIYKTLRKRDVLVNDKRINKNVAVHEADKITLYIKEKALPIVYEDSNILILNKPIHTTVYEVIEGHAGLFPCHRLDTNTSGLVLYAKNKESLNILLEKFKKHEIEKIYACIVHGIPKEKKATLHAFLFKDRKKGIVFVTDTFQKGSTPIVTSYEILKANKEKNIALLDVDLKTGKTHQIRAHLAHLGYPIIGDEKYGNIKINQNFSQKTQLLLAYQLSFHFQTDSGILEYLNNQSFQITYSHFEKYTI